MHWSWYTHHDHIPIFCSLDALTVYSPRPPRPTRPNWDFSAMYKDKNRIDLFQDALSDRHHELHDVFSHPPAESWPLFVEWATNIAKEFFVKNTETKKTWTEYKTRTKN